MLAALRQTTPQSRSLRSRLRGDPGERGPRMSTTTQTPGTSGAPGTMKQTERIQAPMGGPGRGPMGGGMVGQKAMTFWPSAKRLVRRMAPDRTKAIAVVLLAVVSVSLMAL